jgi:hypothetical protein
MLKQHIINTPLCQKRLPQAASLMFGVAENQKITQDDIFTSFIPVLQQSQTTTNETEMEPSFRSTVINTTIQIWDEHKNHKKYWNAISPDFLNHNPCLSAAI